MLRQRNCLHNRNTYEKLSRSCSFASFPQKIYQILKIKTDKTSNDPQETQIFLTNTPTGSIKAEVAIK